MFRDLIKFTAKVAIFAVIVKFVVLPGMPGMPNLSDYLPKLPTWQQAVKFVLDPGDLVGKTDHINQEVNKLPDHVGPVVILKPQLPSTGQTPQQNIKHVLTGGIL